MTLQFFIEYGMKDNLEEGGGGANPEYTKTKSGIFHPKISKQTCNVVHARQESTNKQIKQFVALLGVFYHDIAKHSTMFNDVALVIQIFIEVGEPLFEVNGYNDEFLQF